MKNILVISLVTIVTASCCNLIQYDTIFPAILLELRDETTGEDLFLNGTLGVDSINISNTDFPDQHFNVNQQVDKTIISFGPGQEEYTITVGNNVTFRLLAQTESDEHRCYTDISVTAISLSPYDFQATAVEGSRDWSVIVSIN